jgi:hypothetical protein
VKPNSSKVHYRLEGQASDRVKLGDQDVPIYYPINFLITDEELVS